MITRCRGYQVGYEHLDLDPRWKDFQIFLEEMGERPLNHSIDRIDCDRGYWPDNCRWATASQQQWNKKHMGVTDHGFTGVQRNFKNWQAMLQVHGKRKCLGTFPSPELAAMAYNRGARKYHGEFAKQNVIPELDYYRRRTTDATATR